MKDVEEAEDPKEVENAAEGRERQERWKYLGNQRDQGVEMRRVEDIVEAEDA